MPSADPNPQALTVADLRAFLTEFPDLEVLAPGRARAFATNVRRYLDDVAVLDTDPLPHLAIADLAELHEQARPTVSPATRKTYTSQLARAIAMVTDRAAEDPLWAISRRERTRAPQQPQPAPTKEAAPAKRNSKGKQAPVKAAAARQPQPTAEAVTYPFPLRAGQVITLTLPADLRSGEAARLAAFITSLTV